MHFFRKHLFTKHLLLATSTSEGNKDKLMWKSVTFPANVVKLMRHLFSTTYSWSATSIKKKKKKLRKRRQKQELVVQVSLVYNIGHQ